MRPPIKGTTKIPISHLSVLTRSAICLHRFCISVVFLTSDFWSSSIFSSCSPSHFSWRSNLSSTDLCSFSHNSLLTTLLSILTTPFIFYFTATMARFNCLDRTSPSISSSKTVFSELNNGAWKF